ncbi:hypothetical protein BLA29_006492 [Euroglyphus maynei]|uniref:Uncharacterized protein n=1 Tax=Euroglyphus maynei TaxID=6958 RepID=A0A1Y3B0E4_EURMA|nr:hypothetical protein BLA29_006492 [Euroglyphus maynei]
MPREQQKDVKMMSFKQQMPRESPHIYNRVERNRVKRNGVEQNRVERAAAPLVERLKYEMTVFTLGKT